MEPKLFSPIHPALAQPLQNATPETLGTPPAFDGTVAPALQLFE